MSSGSQRAQNNLPQTHDRIATRKQLYTNLQTDDVPLVNPSYKIPIDLLMIQESKQS